MITNYILDADGNVVPCADIAEWSRWFQTADRVVAFTEIDELAISTVFLGVDHNHVGEGPPVLFETMIFTGWGTEHSDGDICERYCTRAEALAGHTRAVDHVLARREGLS